MENLQLAYKNSRKGKAKKKLVKMVDENPEKYLQEIRESLLNKTYKTSKYRSFILREREKKQKCCRPSLLSRQNSSLGFNDTY